MKAIMEDMYAVAPEPDTQVETELKRCVSLGQWLNEMSVLFEEESLALR